MEHINRSMTDLGTFQVTLRQLNYGLREKRFVVDVTNEPHRTYFHGPAWIQMTEVFKMEPETKCYFYMDKERHATTVYFHYKGNEEVSSSDDSDGIEITLAGADEVH